MGDNTLRAPAHPDRCNTMTLLECQLNALRLMQQYHLVENGWTFGFDNSTRRVGNCDYRVRRISLSKYAVQRHAWEELAAIVKHEIAHAVTPGDRHGPLWRAVCRKMGVDPLPTTRLLACRPKKWYGVCAACKAHVEQNNVVPTATYRHLDCGGRIHWHRR